MTSPPLTEKQLGDLLLQSVKEMKAGKPARKTHINVSSIIEARHKTGLSQSSFASLLGVSVRTLQDWEQGRRSPSKAAETLIRVAQKYPQALLDL